VEARECTPCPLTPTCPHTGGLALPWARRKSPPWDGVSSEIVQANKKKLSALVSKQAVPHLHGVLPARRRAPGLQFPVIVTRTSCEAAPRPAPSPAREPGRGRGSNSAEPTIYPSHSEYRPRRGTCWSCKLLAKVRKYGDGWMWTSWSAYNCRAAWLAMRDHWNVMCSLFCRC
jgi:hypothetical protein